MSLMDLADKLRRILFEQPADATLNMGKAIMPAIKKSIKPETDRSNLSPVRRAIGYAGEKGFLGPVPQLTSAITRKYPKTTMPISHFTAGTSPLPVARAALGETLPDKEKYRPYRIAGGTAATLATGGPKFAAKVFGLGAGLGAGVQGISNILSDQPIGQDVGKSAIQSGLYGLEKGQTYQLTGAIVEKLATTFQIFKPITEAGIEKTLPQATQTITQWLKNLGVTGLKRAIKAALIETPVEGVVWGAKEQDGEQTLAESIAQQTYENFIYNIGFAGVNTLADARTISPLIKKSLDQAIQSYKVAPEVKTEVKIKAEEPVKIKQPDKFEQEMDALVRGRVSGSPPGPSKPPPIKISSSEGGEKLTKAVMGEEAGTFNKIFNKWIGEREVARTTGAEAGYEFRDLPKGKATEFINHAEGVELSKDPQIIARANEWKQTTDRLYQDLRAVAKKEGVDLGYIDEYVTHFWKQSPQEVQKVMSVKGRSFGSRKVPTYKEGIELGLTPKYANPAEIMSEYVSRIEKTKANIGLFAEMKDRGLIVPASVGRNTPGFSPVNAPGFPRSTTSYEGKVFDGSFYAPTSIAKEINRIFSPEDFGKLGKGFKITAGISKKTQDIVLSGGLPGTPLNAFTAAQTVKEFTSGSFVRPIKAFATSLSPEASLEYFKNNAEQIKKMQARNVTVRSSFDTQGLMGGSKVWNKWVSDPTFKRFMHMLQIELFNNVEKRALKMGKPSGEAADIAAKSVANFYGMTDTGTYAKRSQLGKDIPSTFAFAPTYRESMINMWVKSVKALKRPLALENRQNIKFLIGAIATYGVMTYLNERLNGQPMSQNPKGKEDKLLIPAGETTIGIPFLSSIATVPRGIYRIVKDVLDLDFKAAGADTLRTFGSMLIKPAGEMILNEDYFGQEIYDPDAGRIEKGKQIASYLFKSNQHPYIRAALEARGRPLYQTLSKAAELPFRFYKSSSIANAPFWDNYFATKKLDEQLQELRYKDPNKAVEFYNENKAQLDSLDLLRDKVSAYYESGQDSRILQEGGVIQADGHMAFTGTDGKFHLIDTNFNVPIPEFTGNEELDKKIRSSYTSKLSSLATNVVTLFENGIITADEAEEALVGIKALKNAVKAPGKAKKPKKITIKRLPRTPKITFSKGSSKAPPKITLKAPPAIRVAGQRAVKITVPKATLKPGKVKIERIRPVIVG